jgi:hypothetical protein
LQEKADWKTRRAVRQWMFGSMKTAGAKSSDRARATRAGARGRQRWLQRILPAAVSIAALSWLFLYGGIAFADVFETMTWKIAFVLTPALAVYGAVALLLEARSIMLLVERTPREFTAWTAARIKCASYLLTIVNYTLGAGALAFLLQRRAGLRLGESASVVLLISSLDLVVVLVFGAIGATSMAISSPAQRELILGVTIIAVLGFFGGIALLRIPGSLGPLERIRSLTVFQALRTTPINRLLHLVVIRLIFSIAFLSLGGAIFLAFGITPPIGQLVAGMMVVALVSVLPIAVAGLGTSQLAVLSVFGNLADDTTLVALSLVFTAGMILLRAGMGVAFAREFAREALEQSSAESA